LFFSGVVAGVADGCGEPSLLLTLLALVSVRLLAPLKLVLLLLLPSLAWLQASSSWWVVIVCCG